MGKMMEYQGYHAKVEYDPDDNIFVGKVVGIADSLNFHANSTDELVAVFHQSIENYLEFCKQVGKSPEKEYSGTFNVRVSPELHRKAYLKAQQEGVALNKIVENALYAYLSPEADLMSKLREGMNVFVNSMKVFSSPIFLTTKAMASHDTECSPKNGDFGCWPSFNSYNISKTQVTS